MESLSGEQPVNASPENIRTVETAPHNPEYKFCTFVGIQEETGVNAVDVAYILESTPGLARKSVLTGEKERPLYAPADQPKSFREHVEIIRRTLARDF